MPVRELRKRITYSEFLDWCEFLTQEEQRVTKLDLYLAQIAAEVRRGWVANPRSVSVQDFLLETKPRVDPSQSKQVWLSYFGIKAS
jgi:hypothetical protein